METYADLLTSLMADVFHHCVSADADKQTAANSSSMTAAPSAGDHADNDGSSLGDEAMNDAEVTDDSTLALTFATMLHSLDNLRVLPGVGDLTEFRPSEYDPSVECSM